VPPENQRLLLPGNDDAASISGIGTFLGCIVALEQGGKTQVLVPGLLDKKKQRKDGGIVLSGKRWHFLVYQGQFLAEHKHFKENIFFHKNNKYILYIILEAMAFVCLQWQCCTIQYIFTLYSIVAVMNPREK
jgi:hypothetical protein